jgi:hypothetical protein
VRIIDRISNDVPLKHGRASTLKIDIMVEKLTRWNLSNWLIFWKRCKLFQQ